MRIEIDKDLLERAKRALGLLTYRATVEEALRHAVASVAVEHQERRARQLEYLESLATRVDLDVLASDEMWR